MEVIVNFHPSVLKYFNDLIDTLFYENYFLYRDSAVEYVAKLIFHVEKQIHKKKHNISPLLFSFQGNYFVSFNLNAKTTWYFVFDKIDNRYLTKYVFNNYSKEAMNLNQNL